MVVQPAGLPGTGDETLDQRVADAVTLTVAAAARRLGVAPPTLRTWDRRYGLGPSAHRAGAHRRYTVLDLARLDLMRRLVLDGAAPADAARLALATGDDALLIDPALLDDAQREPGGQLAPPDARDEVEGVASGRGYAALAGADGTLHRAAAALDAATITWLLHTELSRRGVVSTWDDVVVPFLRDIGRRWASTGDGIEVEHLVSGAVQAALSAHAGGRPAPPAGRTVLLACAQDEGHSLPLHALEAALAERGVAVHVLGGRLPRAALAAAVRRTGPAAVFLWSQSPATGDTGDAVADVPAVRPAPVVVLGGPGWWGDPPPRAAARVRTVHDLTSAVEVLAAAAR